MSIASDEIDRRAWDYFSWHEVNIRGPWRQRNKWNLDLDDLSFALLKVLSKLVLIYCGLSYLSRQVSQDMI